VELLSLRYSRADILITFGNLPRPLLYAPEDLVWLSEKPAKDRGMKRTQPFADCHETLVFHRVWPAIEHSERDSIFPVST